MNKICQILQKMVQRHNVQFQKKGEVVANEVAMSVSGYVPIMIEKCQCEVEYTLGFRFNIAEQINTEALFNREIIADISLEKSIILVFFLVYSLNNMINNAENDVIELSEQ